MFARWLPSAAGDLARCLSSVAGIVVFVNGDLIHEAQSLSPSFSCSRRPGPSSGPAPFLPLILVSCCSCCYSGRKVVTLSIDGDSGSRPCPAPAPCDHQPMHLMALSCVIVAVVAASPLDLFLFMKCLPESIACTAEEGATLSYATGGWRLHFRRAAVVVNGKLMDGELIVALILTITFGSLSRLLLAFVVFVAWRRGRTAELSSVEEQTLRHFHWL